MAGTTYNDVLSVGMCPKMRPVGVAKKRKKGQKLSCVKLAICPDHPRRRRYLKFCMRGRVREGVTYFKFHDNQLRDLGAVVENRPLPLTRPMAYNCTTACITVQAVILIFMLFRVCISVLVFMCNFVLLLLFYYVRY